MELSNIVTRYSSVIEEIEAGGDFNIIEPEIVSCLHDSYTLVRRDPTQVDTLIELYQLVTEYFYTSKAVSDHPMSLHFWNRFVSFISIKNDLILQSDLTEKNIDAYLAETNLLIDRQHYLTGSSTIFKIIQIIGKIQYAYNIVNPKRYIREEYNSLLRTLGSEFDTYFSYFFNQDVFIESYNMPITFMYYILFYRGPDNSIFKEQKLMMQHIMMQWKQQKIYHYNMKGDELNSELSSYDKYDIIYRS